MTGAPNEVKGFVDRREGLDATVEYCESALRVHRMVLPIPADSPGIGRHIKSDGSPPQGQYSIALVNRISVAPEQPVRLPPPLAHPDFASVY